MLLMPTVDCHMHLEEQHDCFGWLTSSSVLLRSHGTKQSLLGRKKQWEVWKEAMVNKICWDLLLSCSTAQPCDFYCQQQLLHEAPWSGWSFCPGPQVPQGAVKLWSCQLCGVSPQVECGEKFLWERQYGWLQYDADSVLQLKSHRAYVKIGRWCRTHSMWFLP